MTPLHVRRAPSSCDARPACSLAPCFHLQLEADHLQQPHTDAACASHLGEVVCGFTTWAHSQGSAVTSPSWPSNLPRPNHCGSRHGHPPGDSPSPPYLCEAHQGVDASEADS